MHGCYTILANVLASNKDYQKKKNKQPCKYLCKKASQQMFVRIKIKAYF